MDGPNGIPGKMAKYSGMQIQAGNFAQAVLRDIQEALEATVATDAAGAEIPLDRALEEAVRRLLATSAGGRNLYFLGNGGSAANASHLATDFWKIAGMPAQAFNDTSLLTCLGNDLGFERIFEAPLRMFARPGDLVVAMSCSGSSANVLAGVRLARERGCSVLGLSGFAPDNPLRGLGELNLYVPSRSYGVVEVAHLALVHSMLDACVALRRASGATG